METAPCFLKGTRREDQNVIINIKLRYLRLKATVLQTKTGGEGLLSIVRYILFHSYNFS